MLLAKNKSLVLGLLGIIVASAAVALWRLDPPSSPTAREAAPSPDATAHTADSDAPLLTAARLDELRPDVSRFCGDCHATPHPGTFPRDAWFAEVEQGFNFYYESRKDLLPPKFADVVAFYRSASPVALELPPLLTAASSPVVFEHQPIPRLDSDRAPAVSHVQWLAPSANAKTTLLFCDMASGDVAEVDLNIRAPRVHTLAKLSHPAHATPADLDGDGILDLLVAELGTFLPGDHDKGQIVWLKGHASGEFEPVVLLQGLGRVADVQPGDFDGDGDLDLVVAEFGWRKTGRILLLRRHGTQDQVPQFEQIELDDRHGAIHVPPADIDGDGHLDFVALISQEHEVVEAFLGTGDGSFRKQRIFDAGDPSFGSSGIQLVDFDGDGDLDIIYTNGDTLDSKYLKPYHAIHWLENRGEFPFVDHVLAPMPGVYRAVAGDLDGDGDLDVAAAACIPLPLLRSHEGSSDHPLPVLMWIEQAGPGRFVPHVLATTPREGYLALDIGDFDDDGDLDLAAGNFANSPKQEEWLSIWWNYGTSK